MARILAIKLSSLGDVLHALPAVAGFASVPGNSVEWAVQPQFAGLVERFSCVSRVWRVPRPSETRAWLRALAALRKERFDLVVDFQGLLKSAVVARAPRAGYVLGPSFAREGSRFFYDGLAAPRSSHRRHAVVECMDALRHEGVPVPDEPSFPLDLPAVDPDALAPEIAAFPGPRVAVAPFSRWKSKNWSPARFSEAIRLMVRQRGARVYVAGGPWDAAAASSIVAESGVRAANLCGRLSVPESAALFAQCEALLTNDSGPMHLAAAAGTRCVALFGPTSPDRTGPWGPRHRILRAPCPKAPCRRRECPLGTGACLDGVSASDAVSAVFSEV